MRLQKILKIFSFLALTHFVFFVAKAFWTLDNTSWIVEQSCRLREGEKTFLFTERCDMFYHRKAFVAASPSLSYGEPLKCRQISLEEYQALPASTCFDDPFWGAPKKLLDVGFDAFSVWYQRAAVLYIQSQGNQWPGVWTALNDSKFIESFPSPEIRAYPWLIPVIYSKLLALQNSWDPLILQILQLLIFVGVAWLYKKTWPEAPTSFWLLFAFVPIAGQFLFRLYADIWLVFFGLLMIYSLQKKRSILFALSALLLAHTKQEGSLLMIVIYSTWNLLPHKNSLPRATRFYQVLSLLVAILSYQLWRSQWQIPTQFGISIVDLLSETRTYTYRLPRIYAYFADVFFRPSLWMFLWPLVLWSLFKKEGLKHKSAIAPLVLAILVIPVFFLRFPEGAYKETVLTGTNRALWQLLPTAWLLLRHSKAHALHVMGYGDE